MAHGSIRKECENDIDAREATGVPTRQGYRTIPLGGRRRPERRGSRYYGIVKTAIREYRDESGVEFQNVPTVGYVRPTGADQLRAGVVRTGRAGKMLRHGVKTIAGVSNERFDGKHQGMRDHLVGRMRYLAELVKTERRPMLTMVVGTPEVTPPRGRSS